MPADQDQLARRLRRTLDAVVQADFGISEAVVWWIDDQRLHLWAPARLEAQVVVPLRVDLGAFGRQLDLRFVPEEVYDRRAGGVHRGYLHLGTYECPSAGREDLMRVVRQLAPNPPSVDSKAGPRSQRAARWAAGESVHTAGSWRSSPSQGNDPRARGRSRVRAASAASYGVAGAVGKRGGARSDPHTGEGAGGLSRERRSPAVAPARPQPRAALPQASLGEGEPVTVRLDLRSRGSLRRALRLLAPRKVQVVAYPEPQLVVGRSVVVILRLPGTDVVRFAARVVRNDHRRLQLNADNIAPASFRVLRAHREGG